MVDAPRARAWRRPFLAPLWIIAASVLVVLALLAGVWRNALVTTVIVIRPAERQLGTSEDAPLSPAGEARAQRLAELLGERGGPGQIRALHVMNLAQARQTIAVLATRLNLTAREASGEAVEALAARLTREHSGSAVLVVASAAELAPLVRLLAAERNVPAVAGNDYGVMYVVSIPAFGRPNLLRLSY